MELRLRWAVLLLAGLILLGAWAYSERPNDSQFEKIAPIGAT